MRPAEKTKAWRIANPEKVRAMNARRREAHRAWCEAHPERVREIKRASQKRRMTPERTAYTNHKQRAKRFGVDAAGVSPAAWQEILEVFGGRCGYCNGPATERDHVMPLSRGGGDVADNVVPCCSPCNLSKSSKTLLGWIGGLRL